MVYSSDAINKRAERQRSAEETSYWEGVQLANEAVLKTLIDQFAQLAGYDSDKDRMEVLNLLERSARSKLSESLSKNEVSMEIERKVAEATIHSVFAPRK